MNIKAEFNSGFNSGRKWRRSRDMTLPWLTLVNVAFVSDAAAEADAGNNSNNNSKWPAHGLTKFHAG